MLALLAAMTVTAAPAAHLVPDPYAIKQPAPVCERSGVTKALGRSLYRRDNPVGVAPLGKLPPAAMIYAVQRDVNGCPVLTVVRDDVEAPRRPLRPEGAPERRR